MLIQLSLVFMLSSHAQAEPDLYSQCQITEHADEDGYWYVSIFKSNGDEAQSFYFNKTELAQQAVRSCKKTFEKAKCERGLLASWFMPSCEDQIENSAVRAVQHHWAKQGLKEVTRY